MTRRGWLGISMGVASALALASCGWLGGESRYRFRMTVEVDTPQGVRTGSSVMEIGASKQILATPETHPISAGLKGEAVVVDLPDGPIFALLTIRGSDGPLLLNEVTDALNPLTTRTPTTADYMRQTDELAAMGEGARSAELPREAWPMMVRFRDLNDPRSLEKVDPAAIGVRRVRVVLTKEPISTGIDKILKWIDHLDQFRTDKNNPFTENLPQEIGALKNSH